MVDKRKHNLIIEYATIKDAEGMLELDYKIFPKEWHVDFEYVQNIFSKNTDVYNVLKVNGEIKGVCSFLPLKKNDYNSLLNGELEERDMHLKLLNYQESDEVYLYLLSIIVDITDKKNRKEYAKSLILNIPKQLNDILKNGIKIKEIGAIAVSNDGIKILKKLGFKQTKVLKGYNQEYPVFTASVSDVLQSIRF